MSEIFGAVADWLADRLPLLGLTLGWVAVACLLAFALT
jgi:hypothetical protein